MRDSTRVLASRPYLPFEVRQNKIMPEPASPTSDQVDVASMERLQHLASRRLVHDTPPEPLYFRAISPDLPVQRTSYRYSEQAQALLTDYKTDVTRQPPQTCLPSTRIDDRTLGVVPVSTAWTTSAGKARDTLMFPRTHEWKRLDSNGNHITAESVIKKALLAIKPKKVKRVEITYKVNDGAMPTL